MQNLKSLFNQLEKINVENSAKVSAIKDQIQTALDAQYSDWKALQTEMAHLLNCERVDYCTDECGDATAWLRFHDLSDVPAAEREYLENYLSDQGIMVDWQNDVLSQGLGSDEIYINDSGRMHDRGIYQNGKLIISEDAYRDEDDEVIEDLRNELIEAHMAKTGVYPGVYRTSYHDNTLYPVNTQKREV